MDRTKLIESVQEKKNAPEFNVGDTIKVMVKVPEADKVRLHPFEGIVISKRRAGVSSSFTVRNVFYGEGVERIFPLNSPNIDSIEVIRKGKAKRAKLYYLRSRIGKQATKIDQAAEKTESKE